MGSAEDCALAGNWLYVAARSGPSGPGLYIQDVTNPYDLDDPALVFGTQSSAVSVDYDNGVIYLLADSYEADYALLALDVSEPQAPRLVAHVPMPGPIDHSKCVRVHGRYAYVTGTSGVTIVEIVRPGLRLLPP